MQGLIRKIKFSVNQNAKKLECVYKDDLMIPNMKVDVVGYYLRGTSSKKLNIGLFKVEN